MAGSNANALLSERTAQEAIALGIIWKQQWPGGLCPIRWDSALRREQVEQIRERGLGRPPDLSLTRDAVWPVLDEAQRAKFEAFERTLLLLPELTQLGLLRIRMGEPLCA